MVIVMSRYSLNKIMFMLKKNGISYDLVLQLEFVNKL